MKRVNYDTIAHLYDEPFRDHGLDPHLVAYLQDRPWLTREEVRVLDLGCGTGKGLQANRSHYPGITLIGLDLSAGMLQIARERDESIAWLQANAGMLPLSSETIHYAVNQFAYPHFQDLPAVLNETYRVLHPGGQLVIINLDPWSMTEWIMYRYFPETRILDERDFLPLPQFGMLLKEIGFRRVSIDRDYRVDQESLAEFYAFARERHRASHFIAISDQAYQAGLRRLEKDLQKSAIGKPTRPSEKCIATLRAEKAR